MLHLAVSWVAEDTGQRMNDLPELLQVCYTHTHAHTHAMCKLLPTSPQDASMQFLPSAVYKDKKQWVGCFAR